MCCRHNTQLTLSAIGGAEQVFSHNLSKARAVQLQSDWQSKLQTTNDVLSNVTMVIPPRFYGPPQADPTYCCLPESCCSDVLAANSQPPLTGQAHCLG